jgi:hypothetical protein
VGSERRRTRWGWAVAAVPVDAVLVASAGFGITYNTSPSIPVELYRIRPLGGERAGDIARRMPGGERRSRLGCCQRRLKVAHFRRAKMAHFVDG